MSFNVSSAFQSAVRDNGAVKLNRRLYIGSSDYSDRVMRWPQFQTRWDSINVDNVQIDLANTDGALAAFSIQPAMMVADMLIQVGIDYSVSSSEYVTLFNGQIDNIRYNAGRASVSAINRFQKMIDRNIGSQSSAKSYTGSDYLPHDLAWYIMTSHSDLSAVRSTSNPDIDWASYTSWSSVFSASPMYLQARFSGERAIDCLERVGRTTQSAIYIEAGKVKFSDINFISSETIDTINDTIAITGDVLVDRRAMVNRYYVGIGYNPTSDRWAEACVQANTSSVNSFGARDSSLYDKVMWHTNTVSGQKLADKIVVRRGVVRGDARVQVPFAMFYRSVADVVAYVNSLSGVPGNYVVVRDSLDMESASKTLWLEQARVQFRLDISYLNGSDVLG